MHRKSQKEITIVNVKESLNMNNRAEKPQKRSEIVEHQGVYKDLVHKEGFSQPDKKSMFDVFLCYSHCAKGKFTE